MSADLLLQNAASALLTARHGEKRPIIEAGNQLLLGFDPDEYAAKLK